MPFLHLHTSPRLENERGEARRGELIYRRRAIYFRRIERSGANLLWRKCGARGGKGNPWNFPSGKKSSLSITVHVGAKLFSRKSNSLDRCSKFRSDDHLRRGRRSLRFERQRHLVRAFKPTDETIGEEEGDDETTGSEIEEGK